MKRCVICGNPGDEGSTVCSVCGNLLIDIPDPDEENKDDAIELPLSDELLFFGMDQKEPEEGALADEKESGRKQDVGTAAESVKKEEQQETVKTEKEESVVLPEKSQSRSQESGRGQKLSVSEEKNYGSMNEAEAENAEKRQPYIQGGAKQEISRQPYGQKEVVDQPMNRGGEGSPSKSRVPYAQGESGQQAGRAQEGAGQQMNRVSHAQGGMDRSAGRTPQVQGRADQPVNRASYIQAGTGQQANRAPYAQGGPRQTSRTPYAQGGAGQPNRAPYAQGGAGQPNRAPYAQGGSGQPMNRAPYAQGGAGQANRAPYAQGGARQPMNRVPGSVNQPMNRQGNVPNRMRAGQPQGTMVQQRRGSIPPQAGAVRQGVYGQRLMSQAKGMFKSPLFVLLTLLNTVALGMSVAGVLLEGLSFSGLLSVLKNFDIPGEALVYVDKIMELLSRAEGMTVVQLAGKVPGFILCVGLWILFVTALRKREGMASSGFLAVKIVVLLKMIISCVVLVACLILSVTLVVSAWVSGVKTTLIAAGVFLAIMIILSMAVIMYFFCLLHTLKVCRKNAILGEDFGTIPLYTAVVTILISFISIVGLLSAIVNVEIAGIICFACQIGWILLLGIWMLVYRSKTGTNE